MHRRRLLTLGGITAPTMMAGCIKPPGGGGDTPSEGASVSIVSRSEQPDGLVEYDVAMIESIATSEHPARLRVSITNPTDAPVVVGEERDVQFYHVESSDQSLYLYPASEQSEYGPVDPGCWQLTDYVAVPEYYGTVTIDAGETVHAESYVYGHPDLPESSCLPDGDHQLRTTGLVGDTAEAMTGDGDATEFEWGFTLRIGA